MIQRLSLLFLLSTFTMPLTAFAQVPGLKKATDDAIKKVEKATDPKKLTDGAVDVQEQKGKQTVEVKGSQGSVQTREGTAGRETQVKGSAGSVHVGQGEKGKSVDVKTSGGSSVKRDAKGGVIIKHKGSKIRIPGQ